MKHMILALAATLGLGGIAGADPAGPASAPHTEFQQLILQHFDRDHDGRLDASERHRAIRALRQIARQMAIEGRRERQGAAPSAPPAAAPDAR